MDFLQLTQQRFSLRQFCDRTIESEKLDYIRQCVQLAPSAVNFQPWHFYYVTSHEGLAHIRACYHKPWMESVHACFIACSDHEASWKRPIDGKDHADIDISIAVEHLCLAAAEQGLGTCWVCNFDAKMCSDLFHLPPHLEPCVLIPIGYAAPDLNIPAKKRKAIDVIFEDR